MSLPDKTEEKWKKLLDEGPLKAPHFADTAVCAKLLANQERFNRNEGTNRKSRRSIKEKYKKISESQWFKDAYYGKSISETMEIED